MRLRLAVSLVAVFAALCGCEESKFVADEKAVAKAARAFPDDLAKAGKMGFSLDPEHFDRHIPPEENAADELVSAGNDLPNYMLDVNLTRGILNSPRNPDLQRALYLLVQRSSASLKHLRTAAAQTLCDFQDWSSHPKRIARASNLFSILMAESRLRVWKGDFSGMAEDFDLFARVAYFEAQQHSFNSDISTGATESSLSGDMDNILTETKGDQRATDAFREVLNRLPDRLDFDNAIRMDAANSWSELQDVVALHSKSGNWEAQLFQPSADDVSNAKELDQMPTGLVAEALMDRELNLLMQAVTIADSPGISEVGKWRLIEGLGTAAKSGDITYFWCKEQDWLGMMYEMSLRIAAQKAQDLAGLAVLSERNRTGKWPNSMPLSAPSDPFTGKPFIYHRFGTGFNLHCAGKFQYTMPYPFSYPMLPIKKQPW